MMRQTAIEIDIRTSQSTTLDVQFKKKKTIEYVFIYMLFITKRYKTQF